MDAPVTQMFKSMAATCREQQQHGSIQPSEGISQPINISSSPPEREPMMSVEHQVPERINVFVRSLSVSSNPETNPQVESSSSYYVIWRNDSATQTQPDKGHTPRILRHWPTGLRPTRSYAGGEDHYAQSVRHNDTAQEDMNLIATVRRISSNPTLVGGPPFELVQSDDGLSEVRWEAMPPSTDDSPSSPSDTVSEDSMPGNASPGRRNHLQSTLPDCRWEWNDDAPRPQMRTRNDSLTAHDILVHTAAKAEPHPHFADAEQSPSETSRGSYPDNQARASPPPSITITQREIFPPRDQPPSLLTPRTLAPAYLSRLSASANPLLRRQLSNLSQDETRFKSHRDSVALSRLRLGTARAARGGRSAGLRRDVSQLAMGESSGGGGRYGSSSRPKGLERLV